VHVVAQHALGGEARISAFIDAFTRCTQPCGTPAAFWS